MSQFEEALHTALREPLDYATAWALFSGAKTWNATLELFASASKLRDEMLGNDLALEGHLGMIVPCPLVPACKYCSVSSVDQSIREDRISLTLDHIVMSIVHMQGRGVSSITLVGGTSLDGLDIQVRNVIVAVREVSDIDITINVGPSLTVETLRWLKSMKVNKVNCSLETINPKAFKEAKPADDLARRIEFMESVQNVGLRLGTIVMVGLGDEPEDVIRSMLYLMRFRNVDSLSISTFTPISGTPWANKKPASILDALKAMSIGRFLFPDSAVGLAFGGGVNLIPQQLMAGGGNSFMGILMDRKKNQDNIEQIRRLATDLGFNLITPI